MSKKRSLFHLKQPILYVLGAALAGGLLLNILALVYTKNEQKQYAEMTVKSSLGALEAEISAFTRNEAKMMIDYAEGRGALYQPLWEILNQKDDILAQNRGREQLNEAFSTYFLDYSSKFHFFIYFPEETLYLACDGTKDGGTIQKDIVGAINEGTIHSYQKNMEWDVMEDNSEPYLIRTMLYNGVYFGYWITADNLASLIHERITVEEGNLKLLTLNGRILAADRGAEKESTGLFARYTQVCRRFEKIPFIVCYSMPGSLMLQTVFWIQAMLSVILVLLAGGFRLYCVYTTNHIIRPIQKFCSSLVDDQEDDHMMELESSEVLELEQASMRFNRLTTQIRNLKISLYEKEVEQQKEVIEFMKLQIKPHFYLNCLNLAYNMVELERYDECKEMLKLTSDYFRYLLRSNMKKELIRDELAYVKNYLKIQSIRYHHTFQYYIEQDTDTMDCYIPPLIIQGFVENAVKNTVSLERPVDISVTVMREPGEEGDTINIFVTDTGDGFSEEMLNLLNTQRAAPREDGTGIGIYNSIKRLQYHFKEKFHIHFYNSPLGGAVVELNIPVSKKEDSETEREAD